MGRTNRTQYRSIMVYSVYFRVGNFISSDMDPSDVEDACLHKVVEFYDGLRANQELLSFHYGFTHVKDDKYELSFRSYVLSRADLDKHAEKILQFYNPKVEIDKISQTVHPLDYGCCCGACGDCKGSEFNKIDNHCKKMIRC